MLKLLSVAAVIVLLATCAATSTQVQLATSFYKGKTVTLLIGSGVAGGIMARLYQTPPEVIRPA